ncbi:MAG TPA: sigma-70 family RNA polymerase sigma factor [Chloroflexota bacterium]|nr:sigma-70 family RNA polymerase sigma factor [Chloroflexota bacterium]
MQLRARQLDKSQAIPLRQAEFAGLYEAYVGRVYRFVFSHVGNREDAEDVTSQVFVKAYKSLGQFEGKGLLENWLLQIARMAVADFWRERYKLPSVPLADGQDVASPDGASDGARDFDAGAREERVRDLLGKLPANYRQVLDLRFPQRCSIAEIARVMSVSEVHARVLVFRALRRAADLAPDWGW